MNASKTLVVVTMSLCLGVASIARAQDSFFDVFIELMEAGDIEYEEVRSTTYSSIDTEMVSMSLRSSANPGVVLTSQADGSFQVDSFFDITYSVGPTGGPYQVDSFFDVFTELRFDPPTGSGDTRRYETEILSMDLTGLVGPMDIRVRLASDPHRGHVTVLKAADLGPNGEAGFQVDSFFDVFTELSIDGGGSFAPADSSTPLAFSAVVIPEPSSVVLLAGGLALSLLSGRRRRR